MRTPEISVSLGPEVGLPLLITYVVTEWVFEGFVLIRFVRFVLVDMAERTGLVLFLEIIITNTNNYCSLFLALMLNILGLG